MACPFPRRRAADHPHRVMRRQPVRPDAGRVGGPGPGALLARCLQAVPENSRRSHERGNNMAIGPVQLLVLGFNQPDFHGEIIAELERLRATDTVRVIDSLAVYKDADGEVEVEHLSNLTEDEAVELGSTIGA